MNVVVLASGTGSLTKALIESQMDGRLHDTTIVAVGTDRLAPVLDIARSAGVPTFTVKPGDYPTRADWDEALANEVSKFHPDLVVSAGFMRLLGAAFLDRFGAVTINTHPALLPAFPGAHAVRDALAAGVAQTGCTVHRVTAEMDAGPVLAQTPVLVISGDDEASLHERIKTVEREQLVTVVNAIADGTIVLS